MWDSIPDPGITPGPKADAQPLSHSGVPLFKIRLNYNLIIACSSILALCTVYLVSKVQAIENSYPILGGMDFQKEILKEKKNVVYLRN